MRFLGLGIEDAVPGAKTIWLYREALTKAGAVEALFDKFDHFLKDKGYKAMGGQIIDATIVSAPQQHNSPDENDALKNGETPKGWKPAKRRQKDRDARWTQKHNRSYFGYKNHVSIDRRHKLIPRYKVSDASIHDSQKLNDVLDMEITSADVWADSAYRSQEIEKDLKARGFRSRICRKGYRNHPLSDRQKAANKTRSSVRARVEHVFGHQENSMGGKIVRVVGIVRAKMKIGLQNLAYNMSRYVYLRKSSIASG